MRQTEFADSALSAAFESKTPVNISESITSGEHIFTLLATASGRGLSYPRPSAMVKFSVDVITRYALSKNVWQPVPDKGSM